MGATLPGSTGLQAEQNTMFAFTSEVILNISAFEAPFDAFWCN